MAASADQLINELLSHLPAPLDELPPTLSDVIEEAIEAARNGELETIAALIQSLQQLESSLQKEAELQASDYGLCSDAAAHCLSQVDPAAAAEAWAAAAKRAIELDEHAVEAMVLLGDLASTREQMVAWYRSAATAAEHKDRDKVAALMPPLRNHMGAKLIGAGCIADAAQILLPALTENPADSAACRYPLLDVCLRLGWHEEAAQIVSQFPHDPVGPIDFAAAILAYALQGNSPDAKTLLIAAIRKHPGVVDYLVGAESMPRVGDTVTADVECRVTAAEFLLPSLREVEGTTNWIRNIWGEHSLASLSAGDEDDDEAFLSRAHELEQQDAQSHLLIERQRDRLPIHDEVWMYGVSHPPLWISQGPVPTRPYLQLVLDVETGRILHQHLSPSQPSVAEMADALTRAMINPSHGKPRQARAVVVDPGPLEGEIVLNEGLTRELDQQFPQTQVVLGDEQIRENFDFLIADLLQMQSPVETALRDLDGIDDARLAEFYQILANFYRAKPWKMVGGDQLFEIHCDAWAQPQWTAVVMGQLGQEFGIALYDDPSAATRMIETPDADGLGIDTLAVHFNEEFDAIAVDCWHRERNNWALAGPEAHPLVARFTNGSLGNASSEDIEVLMRILPHIPRFLDHPPDHSFSVGEEPDKIRFRWCS